MTRPLAWRVSELERRMGSLLRYGRVETVDTRKAVARVRYADPDGASGPAVSGWLPWLTLSAGERRDWRAPSKGEQVMILSPSGSMPSGAILGGLYSDGHPAPDSGALTSATVHPDGALVAYDAESHELSAVLPEGGTCRLAAPGGVRVEGDLEVVGDIAAEGDISAKGDISDRRGSMEAMRTTFNAHVHPIAPGGAILPTTTKMN